VSGGFFFSVAHQFLTLGRIGVDVAMATQSMSRRRMGRLRRHGSAARSEADAS
jgi:hypothetical protein